MKMRKSFFISLLLSFSIAFLFQHCGNKSMSSRNVSYIYNNDPTTLFPSMLVFHESKNTSALFLQVDARQLLYARKPGNNFYQARLLVKYKLRPVDNPKLVSDSGSVVFDNAAENDIPTQQHLFGKITFQAAYGSTYILDVFTFDSNREQFFETRIMVDKSNEHNRQNFLLLDSANRVVFMPYFNAGHRFTIKTNRPVSSLHVGYFENSYPPALPPFSAEPLPTFPFRPVHREQVFPQTDSTFMYYADTEGIFHFQTDTTLQDGISVFNFGQRYPRVTEPEKMVESIRYISSKNEYANLSNSSHPKTALDLFWISIAGNYEKGRQVIREYYTRTESANRLFGSFQEGWKTDRGIIYVVFGPPNLIYKNEQSEKWIYGEENNSLSVVFEFNKVKNPFTDNDYVLARNPMHKAPWYRTVEAWRQGRIF